MGVKNVCPHHLSNKSRTCESISCWPKPVNPLPDDDSEWQHEAIILGFRFRFAHYRLARKDQLDESSLPPENIFSGKKSVVIFGSFFFPEHESTTALFFERLRLLRPLWSASSELADLHGFEYCHLITLLYKII